MIQHEHVNFNQNVIVIVFFQDQIEYSTWIKEPVGPLSGGRFGCGDLLGGGEASGPRPTTQCGSRREEEGARRGRPLLHEDRPSQPTHDGPWWREDAVDGLRRNVWQPLHQAHRRHPP